VKIWLIEISDFLPDIDGDTRLYRAGMISKALVEQGNNVLWWSSTFNHQLRKQRYEVSTTIKINENYCIRLLYGPGYNKSISFNRLKHIRTLAKEFASEISEIPKDKFPDLIYACYPTLELSEQAVLFGTRNNIPVVVDIRDQWPSIYLTPLPKLLHPIARKIFKKEFNRAKRIFSQATAITGVSRNNLDWGLEQARRLIGSWDKWFPLGFSVDSREKTDLSQNNLTEIRSRYQIEEDSLVVTFIGTFSRAFDLNTVAKVVKILSRTNSTNIKFIIVGDGAQALTLRNTLRGFKNIVLTGWLNKTSIDEILKISSVGLAPYSSDGLITLPNKPFEYMAASLPILSSLEGELKVIIEKEKIGKQYKGSDPRDLKDKILWFFSHPEETEAFGQRAKALFEEKYNADVVYPSLVDHLIKIAHGTYLTNE